MPNILNWSIIYIITALLLHFNAVCILLLNIYHKKIQRFNDPKKTMFPQNFLTQIPTFSFGIFFYICTSFNFDKSESLWLEKELTKNVLFGKELKCKQVLADKMIDKTFYLKQGTWFSYPQPLGTVAIQLDLLNEKQAVFVTQIPQ